MCAADKQANSVLYRCRVVWGRLGVVGPRVWDLLSGSHRVVLSEVDAVINGSTLSACVTRCTQHTDK